MQPAPRPDRPFSVVTTDASASVARGPAAGPPEHPADADWSQADLEAEYLKAVETAEQAEFLSGMILDAYGPGDDPAITAPPEEFSPGAAPDDAPRATSPLASNPAAQEALLALPQVLEALLFVGGPQLTSRRLGDLLGASTDQVEELLTSLNERYLAEHRPYAVGLTDGAWRLTLRPEFEPVRSRVFGQGPRDVKLSQDVLEMLAFVAYQQPTPRERLAETGKPDADALIRQLIRRDLVAVQRSGDDRHDVSYITTPRFLELFGLRSLHDLPRSEDVRFK